MDSAEPSPDDDLKGRLHIMESKLRRIRDQRNSHNESARRAADSRNSINEQSKALRAEIEEKMAEQKAKQARADKAMAIANTIINTAAGVGTYASAPQLGNAPNPNI